MSDTSGQNGLVDPDRSGEQGSAESPVPRPASRQRRGLRIALVSLASLVVFLGAVAVGSYVFVNHLAGSIQRIPVKFAKLDAASQPGKATTVLITGAGISPTGEPTAGHAPANSGLIMLLHVNADGRAGGVVSIPSLTIVPVPEHGQTQIGKALAYGGASLLVQTVEQLTHVQINHYARVDFTHVANVVDAVGGVNVTLPETTSAYGQTFLAGANHLGGVAALDYAREPSLTVEGRVLRQQSLIRAIADKMANEHLLTNPVTMYRVSQSLTKMLTVDSNFTNAEVMKFITQFRVLNSHSGTFVTAPTYTAAGKTYLNPSLADQLWAAPAKDSLAAFEKEYPSTITPAAPH
jgi:LCP family protein required for cell wall assembly